jgi:small subunit ribosomal protein S8
MTHDPIADLLTRIRNGYMARLHEVAVPCSNMKAEILRIFKKNGYIVDFVVSEDKRTFVVTLQDVRKQNMFHHFVVFLDLVNVSI